MSKIARGGKFFRAVANLIDLDALLGRVDKKVDEQKRAALDDATQRAKILLRTRILLEKTTFAWEGGGAVPDLTGNYERARVFEKPEFDESNISVTTDKDAYSVQIVTHSWLWNALDKGTAPHVVKGPYERFLPRELNRTLVGSLDVRHAPQYANHLVTIKKGRMVGGIPARGWSQQIADQLNEEFAGKFAGLLVTFVPLGEDANYGG